MKKIQHQWLIVFVVAIGFALFMLMGHYAKYVKDALNAVIPFPLLTRLLTYLIAGIPIFIGTIVIAGLRHMAEALGIAKGIWTALGLALLFTLPMLIPAFFTFDPGKESIGTLIIDDLITGSMEELYFRGFLFGLLFRKTSFGFVLSIVFGAVLFGTGHLYQGSGFLELLGIFMVTTFGAVWFAWHYVEWNYNLWVPIFLHFLMNLSWAIAGTTTNALGNVDANVWRAITVIGSIVFTVWYKKRKGLPLAVNRKTLWPTKALQYRLS